MMAQCLRAQGKVELALEHLHVGASLDPKALDIKVFANCVALLSATVCACLGQGQHCAQLHAG
jgi:hypothetical protein